MANNAIRELARGRSQTPSYTPYIAADMSASPWPAPTADRTAALAKWMANRQASKPGARPLPFRARILYRARFVITADLCSARAPLGGLADQLNNLSITPRLATTESIGASLASDSLHSAHLEELARAPIVPLEMWISWTCYLRGVSVSRFRPLIRLLNPGPPPAVTKDPTNPPSVGPKAPTRRPWISKKMCLSQLSSAKRAAEAADAASSAATPPPDRAPSPARSRRRSLPLSHTHALSQPPGNSPRPPRNPPVSHKRTQSRR